MIGAVNDGSCTILNDGSRKQANEKRRIDKLDLRSTFAASQKSEGKHNFSDRRR